MKPLTSTPTPIPPQRGTYALVKFQTLLPESPTLLHGFSLTSSHPDLIQYPKYSTIAVDYCTQFLEITRQFPKTILCFTDGPKSHNYMGFAYSIDKIVYAQGHRNIVSNFTTELQAIYQGSTFAPFPPHNFLIASDFLASLMPIQDPYSTYPHRLAHSQPPKRPSPSLP